MIGIWVAGAVLGVTSTGLCGVIVWDWVVERLARDETGGEW